VGAGDVGGDEAADGAEDESDGPFEAGARFVWVLEADADHLRREFGVRDDVAVLVDGDGEFDDGAMPGADKAFAEFEFAAEADDDDGVVDVRDFADVGAGDDAFEAGAGIDDDDFSPCGAPVDPFVVFDIANGGIEREAATA